MIAQLANRYPFQGLKLLVTEVTRMTGGLVCVAGIDLQTGALIRPLQPTGQNWEEDKWVAKGYFQPGKVVGLDSAEMPLRTYPHTNEDFFVKSVKGLGAVTPHELFSACNETADADISSVLNHNLQENKYVVEGAHCRSLLCIVQQASTIRLSDRYDKIQLSFNSDNGWYNLPVTDLQAKESGSAAAGVQNLQDRLDAADSHVAIRLGLARGWDGKPHNDYDPKRCYLQVNGIIGN